MKTFDLGQAVQILGTMRKRKSFGYSSMNITWEEADLPTRNDYPKPKVFDRGVVVGKRTVFMHGTYEYGEIFVGRPGTAFEVWLVAFDLRMAPVMCASWQIQPMESE